MSKANWGKKRACQSCDARFYDMNRERPVCPKCGAVYVGVAVSSGAGKAAVFAKEDAKRKAEALGEDAAEEDLDVDLDDDIEDDDAFEDGDLDEDDDLIEDSSELGEDEDDMAEVMEGVTPDRKEEEL
ncbi:MAG: FYDLN acid domain-containing protein [Alphaproteobacteria bacterium]|nr:FYDLN acid domain-containing protein [Alphaproteobacteria bacterium]